MVLGIPWDVDTEGLKEYMSKFGPLDDCIVMKDRSSGRSRGFGYVTFSSVEDAKNVVNSEHILGDRTLEVKIATPKEEMRAPGNKKATRIFVARIPQSVDESMFRRHFQTFGEITDLYMPKELGSKEHRGIGFVTFRSAECVDNVMQENHEIDGTTVVVDRATPKDEEVRHPPRRGGGAQGEGGYGSYNAYITAATRYAALGVPTLYDHPGPAYGRGYLNEPPVSSKKIFIGRLPQEANTDDLWDYFGRFGRIVDAYIPKVAVDSAAPVEGGPSRGGYIEPPGPYGAYSPMMSYGQFSGSLGYDTLNIADYASSQTVSNNLSWRLENPAFTAELDVTRGPSYGRFVSSVRDQLVLHAGAMRHLELVLLPPQSEDPGKAPWIGVMLRCGPRQSALLRICADNLYISAYRSSDGLWSEFLGGSLIAGAKPLSFADSYGNMARVAKAALTLGKEELEAAAERLTASAGTQQEIARSLMTMSVMVSEAIRFRSVGDALGHMMCNAARRGVLPAHMEADGSQHYGHIPQHLLAPAKIDCQDHAMMALGVALNRQRGLQDKHKAALDEHRRAVRAHARKLDRERASASST
uniref:rRNA N-glycosidase n=1 Tax=Aegilops tauschii TaxID=37682 RepID=M8BYM1_AEGTA